MMPLIHDDFPLTSVNLYSADVLAGELNLERDLRFGVAAFFYTVNSAASTLTLRVQITNNSEGADFLSESFPLSKPNGATHFRIEPDRHFFIQRGMKAKFYLRSSNSSDTNVFQAVVYAFDPNFPAVGLEARASQTVPNMTTTTYTLGHAVGTQITFGIGTNRGTIVGCRVLDKAKQTVPLELWLFRASTTSGLGNNSVFDPDDSQIANLAAVVRIDDWYTADLNSVGQAANLPLSFADLSGGLIYGWVVNRGTNPGPSFVAGALIVELEVLME